MPTTDTTDHLGSICKIYNAAGTKQFDATYDAWGKQTVNVNYIGITRGYTGHEHWNQFGLIDMNGRFYDPVVGRFLSPDPYVQSPTNPQNYNRYSYCLNNPLKYTDPNGESAVLTAAIIGAVIGTYIGGTMANNTYNPIYHLKNKSLTICYLHKYPTFIPDITRTTTDYSSKWVINKS